MCIFYIGVYCVQVLEEVGVVYSGVERLYGYGVVFEKL